MKESYEVRPSQSPWPRVMRGAGKPSLRSVHRGTTGLCIELHGTPETRASFCGGRPCPDKGKAIVMSNDNGESDVTPTESETTCTVGNFSHGSRETPAISVSSMEADRSEKARCHNTDMHVAGDSDSSIVPEKSANKSDVPSLAESMEERGLTKENTGQLLLDRTQRRNSDGSPFVPRSRGLLGIRQAAQKDKNLKFTSLLNHVTPELLRASFLDLKKQAAPGIDGETWSDYANDYERRIEDLHGQIHYQMQLRTSHFRRVALGDCDSSITVCKRSD